MPQQESLCQAFNRISRTVWKDISDNLQLKIESREIGITSHTIMAHLRRYIRDNNSDLIWVNEAKTESKEGGDIDLYIQITNGRYIRILLQAKVLKQSGRYDSLHHLSGKDQIPQWELLEKVEKQKWAKTYYLFYSGSRTERHFTDQDCHGEYNEEQLGIALVEVSHIKNFFLTAVINKIGFEEILAHAIPWRTLVCCNDAETLSKKFKTYSQDDIDVDEDFEQIFNKFSDFTGPYNNSNPDTTEINDALTEMKLKPKNRIVIKKSYKGK